LRPLQIAAMTKIILFDSFAFRWAMTRRGIRFLSQVAREAGSGESYLRHIASGYIPPPNVRERIATVLDVPVETLWREVASAVAQSTELPSEACR
jgi:hypothetical protein